MSPDISSPDPPSGILAPGAFSPNDTLRRYCLKRWGCATLPDAFLEPFLSHARARTNPYKNLNAALRNWIIRESPSARYYSANKWEAALARANAHNSSQERADAFKHTTPSPNTTWVPAASQSGPVAVQSVLARLTQKLDEKKPPDRV